MLPYNPYTGGRPAICAYPMDIGIDTSPTTIPAEISLVIFLLLNARKMFMHSILPYMSHKSQFHLHGSHIPAAYKNPDVEGFNKHEAATPGFIIYFVLRAALNAILDNSFL